MDPLVGALIIIVVAFGLFFVLRAFMCWYWKINQMVALLESIDKKLSNVTISTEKKEYL